MKCPNFITIKLTIFDETEIEEEHGIDYNPMLFYMQEIVSENNLSLKSLK